MTAEMNPLDTVPEPRPPDEPERAAEVAGRAERRFRSLVDGSLDIVTVVDAQGVATFQSAGIERILGWTRRRSSAATVR